MRRLSPLLTILIFLAFTHSLALAGIRCPLPLVKPLFDAIKEEHRGPFPKQSRPQPQLGTTKDFWLWDFSVMPPGFRKVKAKCLAVTEHSYIFVEESAITQAFAGNTVETIVRALEESCPADDNRGILDIDCQIFGEPPDALDNDPRVYFLYADFAEYGHMAFDGYFNAFDQMPDEVAWKNYRQHSNEVEILYLNATGSKGPASDYMLSVLAHEFQHLIHYRYDQQEESWVNEALSEAAMTACGYFTDKAHLAHYCRHTGRPLVDLEHPSYGAVLLFGTYLLEQYGEEALGRLVACPKVGIAGIEEVFPQQSFVALFHRWALANGGASFCGLTDGLYGYKSFPLPAISLLQLAVDEQQIVQLKASGLLYLPLQEKEMMLTVSDLVASEEVRRRYLARHNRFNTLRGEKLPALFSLTMSEDGEVKVAELTSDQGVYELPSGSGFLVISTLNIGSSSFTLTLTR